MNQDRNENIDPDLNVEILSDDQDVYNCKYFSVESFKKHKEKFYVNGLSVVCFNMRSSGKNLDEFIGYLSNCEHSFDIIVLTETWAKNETQALCHIPGFNSTHNFRTEKQGGGVSIFVKDSINFDVIDNLNISSEYIESAAVSISV